MKEEMVRKGKVEVLRRLYPADLESAEGIAVFCCDLVFSQAHRQFLRKNGFGRFVSISIPGGGGFLAQPSDSPERRTLEEYLQLLLEELKVDRMVLISHSGCRWYRHTYPDEADYEAKILVDLCAMAQRLKKDFQGVKTEGLFYAERQGGKIRMNKINSDRGVSK